MSALVVDDRRDITGRCIVCGTHDGDLGDGSRHLDRDHIVVGSYRHFSAHDAGVGDACCCIVIPAVHDASIGYSASGRTGCSGVGYRIFPGGLLSRVVHPADDATPIQEHLDESDRRLTDHLYVLRGADDQIDRCVGQIDLESSTQCRSGRQHEVLLLIILPNKTR